MMRMTKRSMLAALALGACLALTAPAAAQESAGEDGADIGPAVGAEAPDFTLTSVVDGTEHTLSADRGERPVVMVFFRGAW